MALQEALSPLQPHRSSFGNLSFGHSWACSLLSADWSAPPRDWSAAAKKILSRPSFWGALGCGQLRRNDVRPHLRSLPAERGRRRRRRAPLLHNFAKVTAPCVSTATDRQVTPSSREGGRAREGSNCSRRVRRVGDLRESEGRPQFCSGRVQSSAPHAIALPAWGEGGEASMPTNADRRLGF